MAEANPSGAPAAAPAGGGAPLDDLMLAMDVVDTLRHREHLVERELSEGARAEGLIDRLKGIYASQGIEVPERILREGVENLKRDRFVYTPPAAGLEVSLARVYVTRATWGRYLAGGLAALVIAWFGYTALVVWPAERRAEATRIELAETLPKRLADLRDQVMAETQEAGARGEAEDLYASGIAAARAGDRETAAAASDALAELHATLLRQYELRIVSRPGEQSGIWRIPDANEAARNYYLIVEAIDPDGKALTLPVRNEESGKTERVAKWGVRVSEDVFDRIRRDKQDDGIIQNSLVATKARGRLQPEFRLPVLGGAITEW